VLPTEHPHWAAPARLRPLGEREPGLAAALTALDATGLARSLQLNDM
jgi:hypothetical protein